MSKSSIHLDIAQLTIDAVSVEQGELVSHLQSTAESICCMQNVIWDAIVRSTSKVLVPALAPPVEVT